MKEIIMYTDGACSGNPGPGGWGTVLMFGEHKKEISGFMPDTTNNRMELFAAVQGFTALKQPCAVTLYSDSAYLVNAFKQNWIDGWQRNGWKTAAKKPVENQDLWKWLLTVMQPHQVTIIKVKGHADNPWNFRKNAFFRCGGKELQDFAKRRFYEVYGEVKRFYAQRLPHAGSVDPDATFARVSTRTAGFLLRLLYGHRTTDQRFDSA